MRTTIDVRLAGGQATIAKLRADLAETNTALEKAQTVLNNGDRVLEQIDSGFQMAETAIVQSRRVLPKLVLVLAVVGVGVGVALFIRRRNAAVDAAEYGSEAAEANE